MLKEAIEKITDLARAEIRVVKVGDTEYLTKDVVPPPHPREGPKLKALAVSTLTGFVEFVQTKIPADQYSTYMIHVGDHRTVVLLSDPQGFHKTREMPAYAQAEDLFTGGFKFNTFMPHSHFMIGLQTLFVEDAFDWVRVTRVISTIKEERVTQSQDDGLAQQVIAKAGVAVVADVEVPRIVTLKPYRTFREVEQPHSQFVLRLQQKPNALPEVALFEADGGKWKTDAIESIREYLEEQLGPDFGLPIIA